MALGQSLVQNGKVNFTVAYPDLLHCTTIQYPRAFSSSRNVRVIASVSYEKDSVSVHDSAVMWTSDVTQRSFRVCVLESGAGTNGSAVVNWIAFRGAPSGMLDGAASFSTFTSGTKCERVNFAQVWVRLFLILYGDIFWQSSQMILIKVPWGQLLYELFSVLKMLYLPFQVISMVVPWKYKTIILETKIGWASC